MSSSPILQVMRPDVRTKAVTVHLPVDEYRLLKSYASLSNQSMNEVLSQATREHLAEHATRRAMAALVEEHRRSLRTVRTTR
jgi:hypothetical protein